MMTGAFSQNIGKLFSELKLVLFIYGANWEATETESEISKPQAQDLQAVHVVVFFYYNSRKDPYQYKSHALRLNMQ